MRDIITIRIVPNGYVCHGELWKSLDNLIVDLRKKYLGCSFRVVDADIETIAQYSTREAA